MKRTMSVLILIAVCLLFLTKYENRPITFTSSNDSSLINNVQSNDAEETVQYEIKSLKESKYVDEILNIKDISNATVINAAWKDDDSIYFVAQYYEKIETMGLCPIELFYYNIEKNELKKVFEYKTNIKYPYLHIQVQETGEIVLKHNFGLLLLSDKTYEIIFEYNFPENITFENCNLSYDGSKIALAYPNEKFLRILNAKSQKEIVSTSIPGANFIQAPMWSTDNCNLLIFAPTHEFVDTIFCFNTAENILKEYDFSNHIDTYDNSAFLAHNGSCVYRMDCSGSNDSFELIFERYDFDNQSITTYSFPFDTQSYCKSISEKGYMIGYVYDGSHYLLLGDIDKRRVVETEKANFGGGKYPPIWDNSQEKAIVLFTLEGGEWGAVKINMQKIFK